MGGVGAAETVLVTETVKSQEGEPVDETLVLDVALLHTLPLRECEPLPELLRNAVLVGHKVTESVLVVLVVEVPQGEEVKSPVDETLRLGEALL